MYCNNHCHPVKETNTNYIIKQPLRLKYPVLFPSRSPYLRSRQPKAAYVFELVWVRRDSRQWTSTRWTAYITHYDVQCASRTWTVDGSGQWKSNTRHGGTLIKTGMQQPGEGKQVRLENRFDYGTTKLTAVCVTAETRYNWEFRLNSSGEEGLKHTEIIKGPVARPIHSSLVCIHVH